MDLLVHIRAAVLALVIGCLTVGFGESLLAQQRFPVTVIQVPPSNFGSVSELTSSLGSPWTVTLVLQDPTETSLQVALRVKLEGANFRAQTQNLLAGPLLTLTRGVPTVLTAADLASYFNPANLAIQGVDVQQFAQSGGVLPEGAYTICVEVIPVGRPNSAPIGGEGCVVAMAVAYDPPEVVTPDDVMSVLVTNPQLITFSWNHRSPPPPGAQYLLELWDYTLARQNVPLSIDEIVTQQASLSPAVPIMGRLSYNWGPADPL